MCVSFATYFRILYKSCAYHMRIILHHMRITYQNNEHIAILLDMGLLYKPSFIFFIFFLHVCFAKKCVFFLISNGVEN